MEGIRRNRLGQAPCPKKTLGWKTAEGYEPWSEPLERASCCCAAPEETLLDERQRIETFNFGTTDFLWITITMLKLLLAKSTSPKQTPPLL